MSEIKTSEKLAELVEDLLCGGAATVEFANSVKTDRNKALLALANEQIEKCIERLEAIKDYNHEVKHGDAVVNDEVLVKKWENANLEIEKLKEYFNAKNTILRTDQKNWVNRDIAKFQNALQEAYGINVNNQTVGRA